MPSPGARKIHVPRLVEAQVFRGRAQTPRAPWADSLKSALRLARKAAARDLLRRRADMLDSAVQKPARGSDPAVSNAILKQRFERDGYLLFENVVERGALAALTAEIIQQWQRDVASGLMFAGGGNVSGHLNCFPGMASRFVYGALKARGIFALAQELSSRELHEPHV